MKTNNSLKFIKRNNQSNNPKLKESAYKTYVLPLVDYVASVWDPWQKKYINKIEMIKRRAIRYIFNDYSFTSNVSTMLSKLNLTSQPFIPFPGNIQPSMWSRYIFPRSRINIHRYSFFPELRNFGTISHLAFIPSRTPQNSLKNWHQLINLIFTKGNFNPIKHFHYPWITIQDAFH